MFEVTSRDRTTEVLIRGELDASAGPPLRHVVDAALKSGASRVVLNLTELTFLDIRGAEALISCDELARRAGASVRLRRPSDAVRQVLDLAGASDLIPLDGNDDGNA